MKTTPKPSATKNSNDEEFPPLPPLLLLLPELPPAPEFPPPLARVLLSVDEAAAGEEADAVEGGLVVLDKLLVTVEVTADTVVAVACLSAIRAPSTTTGFKKAILLGTGYDAGARVGRFIGAGRPSGGYRQVDTPARARPQIQNSTMTCSPAYTVVFWTATRKRLVRCRTEKVNPSESRETLVDRGR